MKRGRSMLPGWALLLVALLWPAPSLAQGEGAAGPAPAGEPIVVGAKLGAGGRYDDVRMCVATAAGTKGGPAVEGSLHVEVPLGRGYTLALDLPVLRPVIFAFAFDMIQFEPQASFLRRRGLGGRLDLVYGLSLGLTVHHGPDYTSERSGAGRGPSFTALGPRFGAYAGLDFLRPGRRTNFQLGLAPYVSPLYALEDPDRHQGVVVGGMLEAQLRFRLGRQR